MLWLWQPKSKTAVPVKELSRKGSSDRFIPLKPSPFQASGRPKQQEVSTGGFSGGRAAGRSGDARGNSGGDGGQQDRAAFNLALDREKLKLQREVDQIRLDKEIEKVKGQAKDQTVKERDKQVEKQMTQLERENKELQQKLKSVQQTASEAQTKRLVSLEKQANAQKELINSIFRDQSTNELELRRLALDSAQNWEARLKYVRQKADEYNRLVKAGDIEPDEEFEKELVEEKDAILMEFLNGPSGVPPPVEDEMQVDLDDDELDQLRSNVGEIDFMNRARRLVTRKPRVEQRMQVDLDDDEVEQLNKNTRQNLFDRTERILNSTQQIAEGVLKKPKTEASIPQKLRDIAGDSYKFKRNHQNQMKNIRFSLRKPKQAELQRDGVIRNMVKDFKQQVTKDEELQDNSAMEILMTQLQEKEALLEMTKEQHAKQLDELSKKYKVATDEELEQRQVIENAFVQASLEAERLKEVAAKMEEQLRKAESHYHDQELELLGLETKLKKARDNKTKQLKSAERAKSAMEQKTLSHRNKIRQLQSNINKLLSEKRLARKRTGEGEMETDNTESENKRTRPTEREEELEDELETLRGNLQSLQSQFENDLETMKQNLKALEIEKQETESNYNEVLKQTQKLVSERNSLNDLLDFKEGGLQMAVEEIGKLTSKTQTLEKALEELKSEKEQLESLIDESRDNLGESETTLQSLKNLLQDTRNDLRRTTAERASLEKDQENLNTQLNNNNRVIEKFKLDLLDLNAKLATVQNTNEELQQTVRSTQEEKEKILVELEAATKAVDRTKLDARRDWEGFHVEKENLVAQIADSQNRIKELQTQLKLAERTKKDDTSALEKELAKQKSGNLTLSNKLKALNKDYATVRKDFGTKQAKLDQMEVEVLAMRAKVEESDNKVKELQTELNATSNTSTNKTKELEKELNKQKSENISLSNKLAALNKDYAIVRKELGTKQSKIDRMEIDVLASKTENEKLLKEIKEQQSIVDDLQRTQTKLEKEITKITKEKQQAQRELETTSGSVLGQLAFLKQELARQEQEAESLLTETKNELGVAKVKLRDLEFKSKRDKEESEKLKNEFSSEVEKLKAKNKELQAVTKTKSEALQKLEQRLAEATNQMISENKLTERQRDEMERRWKETEQSLLALQELAQQKEGLLQENKKEINRLLQVERNIHMDNEVLAEGLVKQKKETQLMKEKFETSTAANKDLVKTISENYKNLNAMENRLKTETAELKSQIETLKSQKQVAGVATLLVQKNEQLDKLSEKSRQTEKLLADVQEKLAKAMDKHQQDLDSGNTKIRELQKQTEEQKAKLALQEKEIEKLNKEIEQQQEKLTSVKPTVIQNVKKPAALAKPKKLEPQIEKKQVSLPTPPRSVRIPVATQAPNNPMTTSAEKLKLTRERTNEKIKLNREKTNEKIKVNKPTPQVTPVKTGLKQRKEPNKSDQLAKTMREKRDNAMAARRGIDMENSITIEPTGEVHIPEGEPGTITVTQIPTTVAMQKPTEPQRVAPAPSPVQRAAPAPERPPANPSMIRESPYVPAQQTKRPRVEAIEPTVDGNDQRMLDAMAEHELRQRLENLTEPPLEDLEPEQELGEDEEEIPRYQ